MLKKTMTYEDFNGVSRTEDFYFNLSKAEIASMELGTEGGLAEMLKRIVAAKDTKKIIEVFKDILLKAYGIKSDDGRRFIKSEELSKEFSETEAFSDLFIQLATDGTAASDFINAIIPKISKDHFPDQQKVNLQIAEPNVNLQIAEPNGY